MSNSAYKVVKIIDDKQIVINAGSNSFVSRGNEFEIYQPGIEVFDDATGESLGSLDFVKARVEATTVFPKMSICKHIVKETRSFLGLGADIFEPTKVRVAQTLNVNAEDISGGFENVDKMISVGDLVRTLSDSDS